MPELSKRLVKKKLEVFFMEKFLIESMKLHEKEIKQDRYDAIRKAKYKKDLTIKELSKKIIYQIKLHYKLKKFRNIKQQQHYKKLMIHIRSIDASCPFREIWPSFEESYTLYTKTPYIVHDYYHGAKIKKPAKIKKSCTKYRSRTGRAILLSAFNSYDVLM